jgi:hypothetical protein
MLALLAAMEAGRRLLCRFDRLHWLTGTWFWFLLAWMVAGVTSLVAEGCLTGAISAVFIAFAQMIAMAVASWVITRFHCRNRVAVRSWVLAGISLFAGCFAIWHLSSFFGVPREVMKLAFRGDAPLIFTVRAYESEAWTDFTAKITVEFPPGALEGFLHHFREAPNRRTGERMFSWSIHPKEGFGTVSRITTNSHMTVAEIVYMTD